MRDQDGVTIRAATPADAERVAAVITEAFEQYRGRLAPESGALATTPDTVRAELHGPTSALLAEHGDTVVGAVMFTPTGADLSADLYLGRLAVLPAIRGHGVAHQLVHAVEQHATTHGRAGVTLGVRIALTDNHRFFTTLGYREVSRGAHPGFDHPTWINLRKPTPPV